MAIRRFCDRCDYQLKTTEKFVGVIVTEHEDEGGDRLNKDLCASCARQLRDFLAPLPKVKP